MGLDRWLAAASLGTPMLALVLAAACSSGSLVLGRIDEPGDVRTSTGDAGGIGADATADAATCDPPPPSRHYTFDGTGTDVIDKVGGPPGRVVGGAVLDGSGVVRLDGADDYVDLPNGVFAGLDEVSIALWVRYASRPAYVRLFDFGSSSLGEDPPESQPHTGRTYLALTPATGFVPSGLALLMSNGGPTGETVAATDVRIARDQMVFVVVVVATATLSMFYEGQLVARIPRTLPLSAIVDQNVWLGRSQYGADPHTEAEYADLRIFPTALADCAVTTLQRQGSDPR